MLMRNNKFANGLIVGGIIGATISMMNRGASYRIKRKIARVGRHMFSGRNGIMDAISDMF